MSEKGEQERWRIFGTQIGVCHGPHFEQEGGIEVVSLSSLQSVEAKVERLTACGIEDMQGEIRALREALEQIESMGTIESVEQTTIARTALLQEGE